ncbi:unnamed protein product [Fraxinus pennsylvanica]|uniref:Laccase n=1 Tax=Fraxinus pennsylvanica TaxID=56036 RepID=A0AAD1ZA06_9LAMI|nr:unnamed protein product [Fraxinus pennsylvanica]
MLMFFSIANNSVTVVGSDASYTKPIKSDYITISPGQTIDFLLKANQKPSHYYMATHVYASVANYNNKTTTIIDFTGRFRSLGNKDYPVDYPVDVPKNVTNMNFFTLFLNTVLCPNNSCKVALDEPFLANIVPRALWRPRSGTKVVLDYNSTVEIIFQGTNTVGGIDHPMQLHGQSYYVVGWGFGNFDRDGDPLNYNIVDPPLMNTIAVPINGWTTVIFKASVWLLHCHLERHVSWGMEKVFITKDGKGKEARMLPPPPDMPPC